MKKRASQKKATSRAARKAPAPPPRYIAEFDGNWTPQMEQRAIDYIVQIIERKGRAQEGPPQMTLTKSMTPDSIKDFILGKRTIGELFGLTAPEAYSIAQVGQNYMEQGKFAVAEAIFKGLITMVPIDSYFHTLLGAVYQKDGRPQEALEEYNAAIFCNANDLDARVNRAELHLQEGRLNEALNDLQTVIQAGTETIPAVQRARLLAALITGLLQKNKPAK